MYNVAIVGATGNVGRKFLEILEQRDFPVKNLYLFASKRSAGTTLQFKGKDFIVEETCDENIVNKKIDFALFSAGGSVS
ncbi:MAG: aspartate-semialdehyde dehydrogenase, partial [Clostridium paraputrificum]